MPASGELDPAVVATRPAVTAEQGGREGRMWSSGERGLDLAQPLDVLVGPDQAAVHGVDREVGGPEGAPLRDRLAPISRGAGAGVDAGLDSERRPVLAGRLAPGTHFLDGGWPAAFERSLREIAVGDLGGPLEGRLG